MVHCPKCSIDQPVEETDAYGTFCCRMCGGRLKLPASAVEGDAIRAKRNDADPDRDDDRKRSDRPRPRRDDDDYDDSPRQRSRRDDDDYDDPPRHERRRDYDDEDRPRRRKPYCSRCDYRVRTYVQRKITSTGWTLICVGFLFWPLVLVGVFMTEEVEKCDECGKILRVRDTGMGMPG